MEGDDSVEGDLGGSTMSGLVRVGEGSPIGIWILGRTCIFNGYSCRIDLGRRNRSMHANRRKLKYQMVLDK